VKDGVREEGVKNSSNEYHVKRIDEGEQISDAGLFKGGGRKEEDEVGEGDGG
jgi:hypothetical protein